MRRAVAASRGLGGLLIGRVRHRDDVGFRLGHGSAGMLRAVLVDKQCDKLRVLKMNYVGTAASGCPVERSSTAAASTIRRPFCATTLPAYNSPFRNHSVAIRRTLMSLAGHVAFVTGASQGIGRTCALRLAKEGATLAVAARNQEKLNELVNEITTAGGKAFAFALDVGDEEQVKSTVKSAIAQFGKVDIL